MQQALSFEVIPGSEKRQETLNIPQVSALDWISENCVFSPEQGGPHLAHKKVGQFLFDFQKEVIESMFDENGDVKINGIFIGFSRKFGKSWLLALCLQYLFNTKFGWKCQIVSGSMNQANLLFKMFKDQFLYSPPLIKMVEQKKVKVKADIIESENGCIVEKVPSTGLGNLGKSADCICLDELSAIKTREVYNVLSSGAFGTSGQKFLTILISNPPLVKSHWSFEYVESLKKNDAWKVYQYAIAKDKDVFDESNWKDANPLIGEYLKNPDKNHYLRPLYENFKEAAKEAKDGDSEVIAEFRRFRCGQRLSLQASVLCDVENIKTITLDDFKKLKDSLVFYAGIDLGIHDDFSCVCLAGWDSQTGNVYFIPFLHMAKIGDNKVRPNRKRQLESRHDRKQITIQEKAGQDHRLLENDVWKFLEDHNLSVQKTFIDVPLYVDGSFEFSEIEKVRSGPYTMTLPTRRFQAWSTENKFFIVGENPEFKEHLSNCLVNIWRDEYCIPYRSSRFLKIDGAVAAILSIFGIVKEEKEPDFNEDDFKSY